jgi:hypothetical protein
MPDEAVVSDRDEFAYEGVRLNFGSIPDNDPALNFDEGADATSGSEGTFVKI